MAQGVHRVRLLVAREHPMIGSVPECSPIIYHGHPILEISSSFEPGLGTEPVTSWSLEALGFDRINKT